LRSRVHTVAGTVVDAAGNPAQSPNIELRRKVGDGTIVSTAVRARGSEFMAHGVESGHYFLIVNIEGSSSDGRSRPRERLVMPMSIQNDITGLFVSTSPGTAVNGRVVFDGQPPRGARITVESRRDDEIGRLFSETASAAVENDGRFVLPSVFGPQVVRVVGLPSGWFVNSVRYRDRDISYIPTTFVTQGSAEVEIRISNRGARLSAVVRDGETPFEICNILVFPVEAVRWSTLAASFSGLAREGVCEVGVVRPGEYFVLAATPADMASRHAGAGADINTSVLERAARVMLKPGDTQTVELNLAGRLRSP
jgi:uncharacterized protein (DUF2237 family)